MSSPTVQERIQKCREEALDFLDLGNCGLTEIPQEVLELNHLKSLNLGERFYKAGRWIKTPNKGGTNRIPQLPREIGNLKNLKELSLFGNPIKEPQILKELKGLTHLNLGQTQVKSFEFLKSLEELTVISFYGLGLGSLNKLKDWLPAKLTSLDASKNQLKSMEGLDTFPKLQYLNLNENRIRKIEGLNKLSKLRALYLGLNQLRRIENIQYLTQLETLSFGFMEVYSGNIRDYYLSNFIQKIEHLDSLKNITKLDLSGNLLTKIKGLKEQVLLEVLYIGHNQLTTSSGIEHLINLRTLSFGFATKEYNIQHLLNNNTLSRYISKANQIRSTEGLSTLIHLKYLSFDSNQISRIKGIETLSDLNYLKLNFNQISQIQRLDQLTKLETLNLESNQITQTQGLEKLINLKILNLNFNQISQIQGLEKLINLKTLYLTYNQISQIQGLEQLTNLTSLYLNHNQISQIQGLEQLTNLTSLYLNSNQISQILGLEQLTNLNTLYLNSNQISQIQGLEKLTNLNTLYLNSNQISQIQRLEQLTNLNTLNLDSNQISQIQGLEKLTNLNTLELSSNKISQIQGIDNLKNLNSLSLQSNRITQIQRIGKLAKLKTLDLESNKISHIQGLDKLTNLKTLYLESNQIYKIQGLEALIHLKTLWLQRNQISQIQGLEQLTNLKTLWLSSNQISQIQGLEQLTNLKNLRLDSNQISQIQGLEQLTNLKTLWLSSNQISQIQGLEQLTNLNTLNLDSNQISQIQGLEQLTNLNTLGLSSNQISQIQRLEQLTNLNTLELSSNQISQIQGLEQLTNLNTLYLDSNQISQIQGLEQLTNLNTLELSSNQISQIQGLKSLSYLQELFLSGNPIESMEGLAKNSLLAKLVINECNIEVFDPHFLSLPNLLSISAQKIAFQNIPSEITNQENCLADARIWFQDLAKDSEENNEVKLMIIGNGRVGKTSVLKRTFLDIFDDEEDSTHGIQLYKFQETSSACQHPLEINSWDFGGQEIYHATHRLFMQSRAVYLCLWDWQIEKERFAPEPIAGEEVAFRNYQLTYWLDHARSLSWKSPLLVAQNKVDKHGIKWPDKSQELQKRHKIHNFYHVSAASKDGIPVLKAALMEQFGKMPEVGMKTPAQWMRVKAKLLELKETQNTIPYDTFIEVCQGEDLHESSFSALIRFLHNTGTLFYQGHLFKNQIILNQEWALEGLYAIFERGGFYKQIKKAKGYTSLESLEWPWQKYDMNTRKVFLSMMESCEICFKVKEDDKDPEYIITEFLSDEKREQVQTYWEHAEDDELFLKYQTRFFHRAFISRFIAQVGRLAKKFDHIWRNGIWLSFEHANALVEAFPEKHQILIRIRGSYARYYLYLINKNFREIFYEPDSVGMEISIAGEDYLPYEAKKAGKGSGIKKVLSSSKEMVELDKLEFFTEMLEARSEEEAKRKLIDLVPKAPLKDLEQTQAEISQEDFEQIRSYLKNDLGIDLEQAIESVNQVLESGHLKDGFINIQGRYSDLSKFQLTGQMDLDKYTQHCNQIRGSLLKLIDKMNKEDIVANKSLDFLRKRMK